MNATGKPLLTILSRHIKFISRAWRLLELRQDIMDTSEDVQKTNDLDGHEVLVPHATTPLLDFGLNTINISEDVQKTNDLDDHKVLVPHATMVAF